MTWTLLAGWDKGVDLWIHHLVCVALAYCVPYFMVLWEMTAFALCMEISTPVLLLMLTLRKLDGFETAVACLSAVFAGIFMLVRPLLYGYGVARSLTFWLPKSAAAEATLAAVRARWLGLATMQALFVALWVLQAYWAVGIGRKVSRALRATQSSKED